MAPALPLTHCSPDNKDVQFFCGENGDNVSGLVCARFPPRRNESDLLFEYRSYVYFGQFTVICKEGSPAFKLICQHLVLLTG